ncbi:uncharacterized protein LOC124951174 [Vespa velutina]|uniref:uncharacterized protein LOC124951174 n=1 Tax=Vespa velutina TaxID=202808 RepID=UPI001FB1AA86|nr:uncharacterized protein LOC124951174 [Vespa velutina]
MPEETLLVRYADDITVLIAARYVELAQLKLHQVMRTVNGCMTDHGLLLEQTEIVILTKMIINITLPSQVGGIAVESKPAIKYLGIMIDRRLNFVAQIQQTPSNAAKGVTSFVGLWPTSPGLKLQEVVPEKSDAGTEESNTKNASAYRTVSEPAILIIAGVIPIALLVKEC